MDEHTAELQRIESQVQFTAKELYRLNRLLAILAVHQFEPVEGIHSARVKADSLVKEL